MFFVAVDALSLVVTALQVFNLFAGVNESQSPTPYSKFAKQGKLPSKLAMLVIYSPAFCVSIGAVLTSLSLMYNGRELLTAVLLLIHFGKRMAEVCFLHIYSGHADPMASAFIGTFYALLSAWVVRQQRHVPADFYSGGFSTACVTLGAFLFVSGQAANFYHHLLLVRLRLRPPSKAVDDAAVIPASHVIPDLAATPDTAQTLRPPSAPSMALPPPKLKHRGSSFDAVPTGGGFDYVTMPHYTAEIIAWLGLSLCSQHLSVLLVACGMASYLAGRASATTQWYRERFGPAWPEDRRHIFPMVF